MQVFLKKDRNGLLTALRGAISPPGREYQDDQHGREVILQFGAHQVERPADFEIDMADGNSQFGGDLAVTKRYAMNRRLSEL